MMLTVSFISRVVWLTTAMRTRCRTGSKPGVNSPRNRSAKAAVRAGEGSRISSPIRRASSRLRMISEGAKRREFEKVALVSSCSALPWMITL